MICVALDKRGNYGRLTADAMSIRFFLCYRRQDESYRQDESKIRLEAAGRIEASSRFVSKRQDES